MKSEKETKESLLASIEELISYGKSEPTINPALLEYLDYDSLHSIKTKLQERVGKLSDDDKEWLMQFRSEG